MLGGEVLVLEPLHFGGGRIEQPAKARAKIGFRPIDLGQAIELGFDVGRDASRIDPDLLQNRRYRAILLLQEGEQQVFGRDLLVLGFLGERLRLLDSLLGLLR